MLKVNIKDAKAQLPSLVDKAGAGESFVITKNGRPLALFTPYVNKGQTSRIGFLKGRAKVPADFNSMGQNEISSMFEIN